ncbi:MAG: hypothetical protein PHG48_01820 [Eubacteriales bacterium]|nr:hypothetical protein [Eubacteriales bacterium]
MKECDKGHIYDESMFQVCPYCFVIDKTDDRVEEHRRKAKRNPLKKSKRNLSLILAALTAAAFITAAVVWILNSDLFTKYKINEISVGAAKNIPQGFSLYSNGNELQEFTFLYPEELKTGWTEEDGAFIYCGDKRESPYILVHLSLSAKISPERYFSKFGKMVEKAYLVSALTPISEVAVGGKTLYMVRYTCHTGSETVIIDRYLELYDDFYIQYTASSGEADSLNTPMYYAILTMKPSQGFVVQNMGDKLTGHTHEKMNFAIDIPAMLELKEIPIGYYADNESMIFFAAYSNSDPTGASIYDRNDFILRAAEVPGLVAAQIGVDSAEFGNGTERYYGGVSFYCYPMTMVSGNFKGSGSLCIADTESGGCYFICFAARDGVKSYDAIFEIGEKCAESFQIIKKPDIKLFKSYRSSKYGFEVLYAEEEVKGGIEDDGRKTIFYADEAKAGPGVFIEKIANENAVVNPAEYIRNYYNSVVSQNLTVKFDLGRQYTMKEGRYEFIASDITYSLSGAGYTNVLMAGKDKIGNLYVISYGGQDGQLEDQKTLAGDLVWSLRNIQ